MFLKKFQETTSRMGMRILFQASGTTQRPVMVPYKAQSVSDLFARHVPSTAEFVLFIASKEGDVHGILILRYIECQHNPNMV